MATGPATGKLIRVCSWPVAATRSEVHVTMVGPLDSAGQAATLVTLGDEVRRLHRNGMAEEVKDVGGIHCSILTPGKATKPPRISTCMGAAKDVALLVDMRSQTKALTLDEAKHLFDAAAARLR